jgi:hypothetical protein
MICGILHIPQEKWFYLGCPTENCSISIIIVNKKKKFYPEEGLPGYNINT